MPLGVGLLNCYMRPTSVMEAIIHLDSFGGDWVMGLTEPNFKDICDDIAIHFTLFQSRCNGKAAIICNSPEWELLWAPVDADIVIIRKRALKLDLIVACLYISQTRDIITKRVKNIIKAYHDFHRKFPSAFHIVMGDFNARHPMWSFKQRNPVGDIIGNAMLHLRMESAFAPNELNWTHLSSTQGSCSWIDAILLSTKLRKFIKNRKIMDIDASDHRMLYFCITKDWSTNRINTLKLNKLAKGYDVNFLQTPAASSKEADLAINRLSNILTELHSKSMSTSVAHNHPMLPTRLSKMLRKATRREKKFSITKNLHPERTTSLSRLCIHTIDCFNVSRIPKIFRKIRKRHNNKKLRAIEKKRGPWFIINKMLGRNLTKSTVSSIHHVFTNPNDIACPTDLRRSFSDQCLTSSPNRPLEVIFDILKTLQPKDIKELTKATAAKPCYFDTHLSNVPLKAMLKYHGDIIIKYIGNMIACGHVPIAIKKAKLKLIPKKDPSKFRPLSILHPLYRLIDAILLWTILKVMDTKLLQFQFAFIKKSGAIDLHLELKSIYLAMKSNDLPIGIIAIDLTDAFERISFSAIRLGLKNMGIDENLIKIIIGHIINRQTYLDSIEGRSWKTHQSGAPQGGFLSPLLFIIGLSCIWHLNEFSFRIIAYADDIFIIVQIDNLDNPWGSINSKLETLTKILTAMNLHSNPTKSKVCIIHRPELTKDCPIDIQINGTQINSVQTIDILGVHIGPLGHKYSKPKVNDAKSRILELRDTITPFASRIQSLPLHLSKTLIQAIIGGVTSFVCPIQRIWSKYDDFYSKCSETMDSIGQIVKLVRGMKLALSNHMAFYIVFRTHLAVKMEKLLFTYIRNIHTDKPRNARVIDMHNFDPYGILIIKNNIHDIPYTTLMKLEDTPLESLPTINYYKRKIGFDLWYEFNLSTNSTIVTTEKFRYWSYSSSFLDCLEDALSRFIEKCGPLTLTRNLSLSCENALSRRITSPHLQSRLTTMMKSRKYNFVFKPYRNMKFHLTPNDWQTIPRTVLEFSLQYWQLFNFYTNLSEAENHERNIILSSLLFSQFNAFANWKTIWRFDLYNLCNIAGAWRQSGQSLTCPNCKLGVSTRILIFGCCGFYKEGSVGNMKIDLENIVTLTSEIKLLRGVLFHFRENLRKVPVISG